MIQIHGMSRPVVAGAACANVGEMASKLSSRSDLLAFAASQPPCVRRLACERRHSTYNAQQTTLGKERQQKGPGWTDAVVTGSLRSRYPTANAVDEAGSAEREAEVSPSLSADKPREHPKRRPARNVRSCSEVRRNLPASRVSITLPGVSGKLLRPRHRAAYQGSHSTTAPSRRARSSARQHDRPSAPDRCPPAEGAGKDRKSSPTHLPESIRFIRRSPPLFASGVGVNVGGHVTSRVKPARKQELSRRKWWS